MQGRGVAESGTWKVVEWWNGMVGGRLMNGKVGGWEGGLWESALGERWHCFFPFAGTTFAERYRLRGGPEGKPEEQGNG